MSRKISKIFKISNIVKYHYIGMQKDADLYREFSVIVVPIENPKFEIIPGKSKANIFKIPGITDIWDNTKMWTNIAN